MRYAVMGAGKRVRPLLAHAAGEVAPGRRSEEDLRRLDVVACALECIHAYSLVHDDMPCMDNDVLRRGKPTVHVQYDEATALLVGDSLQTLAFELLGAGDLGCDAGVQVDLVRDLAHASGSTGMAGGQAIDLESVGRQLSLPELEGMHARKTGALIKASVLMGARAPGGLGPSQIDALTGYADCVGLAFQVVDDVLDSEASTETLGKTAGKDAAANKPTYVNIMGLEQAKVFANELRARALDHLAGFGASAQRLSELANFIVLRKF
jgi:farnesyl diphosphate synthase